MASETSSEAVDFVVERGNLRSSKVVRRTAPSAVDADHVLLRVDQFAFTANNVTYGVVGEMLSYWSFFPAEGEWGRIPVWGFADVLRSRHSGVAEGTRVFGYLPMSTHLVVRPDHVGGTNFIDATPHRAGLPPIYNRYVLAANEPGYTRELEDMQMLFRPLFMTAFLIDDVIADNDRFGADAVILSSASSKTAFSLAFLLSRAKRCRVIGLTSKRNAAFVESLGCYDRVVTYDDIASLAKMPVTFVDMAGDGNVLRAVHQHFGDGVKNSTIVGVTHWEQQQPPQELPGATPTFFFAPTQLEKRTADWGPEGLQQRYGAAWRDFLGFAKPRINVVHGRGPADVERVYLDMVEGRVRPDQGHILTLWT